jgi:glycosyltransferase involved in cell wall biosynthesis
VVPGRILHLWHGETRHRRYHDRSQELASFGFDPARDIRISARGCWEWASDKPDLHRWSRRYFDVRHEDGAQEIAAPVPAPVVIAPPPVAVAVPAFQDPLYVTFLVGRSHAGGVARVVREAAVALTRRRATMKVIVLDDAQPAERLDGLDRVHTVRIDPRHARPLHAAALEALATPSRAVLACEVAGELAPLRTFGAQVVPVVLDGAHAPALDRRRDPLAIALSDGARRRLDEQRAGVPIVTLRPEIASPRRPEDLAKDRAELRHRYGIPASAIVVGMIGEFDATRGYTRAVRAFAALRARADARLMIVGGWQGELGRAAHAAATRLALDLGVLPDLVLVGDAAPTAPFHAAFDVLLDASLDGAAGLDALDAAAAACPVIAATTAASTTVDVADPEAVAAAILDESQPAVRRVAAAPSDPDLFARVLALLAHFGLPGPPRAGTRALIIADTLGADAPARALRDLLLHLPDPAQIVLGLLSPGAADTAAIARAGVTIASVHTGTSMLDKIERLLVLAERSGCQTIAFWQVPARIKLTIAKILEASPVRLVDVARGPAFGRELADAAPFARRLSLTAEEYLARLDMIVARDPTVEVAGARRAVVIPDGVARAAAIAPVRLVDGADAPLDPRCAIGTCVRLAPGRRIERLIAALALVARTHPRVSLTILGSAQPGQADYAAALADAARDSAGRVRFVGAVDAPAAYLAAFRIFARPSHEDDAPSLVEVMATGVPIVELGPRRAADPIVHGRTGFFVGDEPAAIAAALVRLLDDGGLRRRIGAAARRRAQRDFGIERMVDGYLRALALPRARRRAR